MIRKKIACLMIAGGLLMSLCTQTTFASASTGKVSVGDLIMNNTFDNGVGLPWNQVETYPADADFNIDGGTYNIKIVTPPDNNKNKDNRWAVQFRHRGLTLEQGHTYTVSFTATATADCKVYPKIGQQGKEYKEYWNYNHKQWQPVNLKANVPTTVTESFTMTDPTEAACEFAFHLVGDCIADNLPYTVSFDNIHVKDPLFLGYDEVAPEPTNAIRVNQVGYFANLEKKATVVSSSTTPIAWRLLDNSNNVVKSGQTTVFGKDAASGDRVHTIDFSDYKTEGTGYKLEVDSADVSPKKSMTFKISNDLYTKMKSDAIKYFYHNRSGIPITMPYAGASDLTRAAGHANDQCTIIPSDGYNESGTVDVSGGWYDAGDHGKYVVNGGISTWTMLNQYERALYNQKDALSKAPFADKTMNIPESGNGIPDILDEAGYNLKTLLKFQIKSGNMAGMVHHKAHDERWTALGIAPADDKMKRFIQPPSTAATLNLAAIAAQGSRLYKTYDSTFANQCLKAAETAWDAAVAHPEVYAPMTGSTGGGAYGDTKVTDEFYWAACELYATTGESKYLDYIKSSEYYLKMPTTLNGGEDHGLSGAFDWGNVEGLGTITLSLVPTQLDAADLQTARANITAAADKFIANENAEGYGTPMPQGPITSSYNGKSKELKGYPWGSNSFVANEAIVMSYANDFNKSTTTKYIDGTARAMDYLLGNNANVQSYVTGYGSNPLENPHHRFWSYQADNAFPKAPAGCMSGGPNSGLEDPWVQGSGWKQGSKPAAKCFMDNIESWSTNEITINWNAPFAWITSYMDDNGAAGGTIPGEGTKGDTNSDGEVDSMDYIALQKYIMDPSSTNINTANADLNSDGKINTADLFALRKIITSN
jgi:endoglucanase